MSDEQLATIEDKGKQLDLLAEKFSEALSAQKTPFSSAIVLAQGIGALRELLDDQIMGEIMKLANTPLGFKTDRPNDKNPKPYAVSEVKDAIIEAALRGFRVAGNEFNIIAGNFYAAKNGLRRKVLAYPGVSDFKDTYAVPRMAGDKGAVITAEATWLKDGVKQKLNREFAVRSNNYMGTDALIGKCERKLCAAVLNWLSGITTPEGEIDDAIPVRAEVTPETARSPLPTRESLTSSVNPGATETPIYAKTSDSAPSVAPSTTEAPKKILVAGEGSGAELSQEDPKTGEANTTATVSGETAGYRYWIRKQLVEAEIGEPAFMAYLRRAGIVAAKSKNLDYVPEEIVKAIVEKWPAIAGKYKEDQGP